MEEEIEKIIENCAREVRKILGNPSIKSPFYFNYETELADMTVIVGQSDPPVNSEVPNEVIDLLIQLQNDCFAILRDVGDEYEFDWFSNFSEVEVIIHLKGPVRPLQESELTDERINSLTTDERRYAESENYEMAANIRDMVRRRVAQRQINP
jgi:hypothetical protein